MTNENIITLAEAIESLRGRPGLVYGPLATTAPVSYSLAVETAVGNIIDLNDIDSSNLGTKLDELLIENTDKANELKKGIYDELTRVKDVRNLPSIVNAGWSMCISLTRDLLFESALQNLSDSTPSSKSVTIVDHFSVVPGSRTTPIYKLLGNMRNNDPQHTLVLSDSELLKRKGIWRSMLATCTDYLQGNPILFFGIDDSVESLAQELLSTLSILQPPAPNSLIFLKDDPILKNPTVRALCSTFSNVKIVDSDINEFSQAIKEMKPKQFKLSLVSPNESAMKQFSIFDSIVSLVPSDNIEEKSFKLHRKALIDSLFRPTSIDWDPYLCGLDIKRDCTDKIIEKISTSFEDVSPATNISTFIVRGEVATGKTTMLKRVAIEMSKSGFTTFWCRRAPMTSWIRTYKTLSTTINNLTNEPKDEKQKIIFFVDDPWSLRLDPSELIACFEQCDALIVFVFALRNTEYFNQNGFSINLPYATQEEIELPTQLSETEIVNLSEMLVRIGAVSTQEESNNLVNNLPTKNTDDVLCSLWYSIPETRSQLANSIKDEYYRLGSANNSIEEFASSAALSGEAIQHAYEFVCVTSKFQIPLPMEVLVRALHISYEEFIDITIDGKPLWGLLYDEEDEENKTVLYRTRNEIVTRVLLELVNGGVGHAGEFRILKTLLSSCDIGSQIYREFATEVLVRTSRELEKYLTYEQGLELFEVTESVLPHEDRLLAHHKGLWMQRVGKKYDAAYAQFDKALDLQQYPGDRKVYIEHIHTSLAASVVGLVKEGKQNPSKGLQLVQDHIQQASNPKIFNAHTGHVSANLLFEMALQSNTEATKQVSFESFSGALREVEKTIQSIGPVWKNNPKLHKSVELLTELQGKIISSVPDDDTLEEYAYEIFNTNNDQMGFELLLRKMFTHAQIKDKGKDYNKVNDVITDLLKFIIDAGSTPNIESFAIRTDLMIRWKLQKPSGGISWENFRNDLQVVVDDIKYRESPLKNFYLAVALFHLENIEQSNAIFSNLRRMQATGLMPKKTRSFFIGTEGFPKSFQCSINRSNGRSYANIPELNTDILVATYGQQTSSHVYISFSLNGPLAWLDKPDDNQMLLA